MDAYPIDFILQHVPTLGILGLGDIPKGVNEEDTLLKKKFRDSLLETFLKKPLQNGKEIFQILPFAIVSQLYLCKKKY